MLQPGKTRIRSKIEPYTNISVHSNKKTVFVFVILALPLLKLPEDHTRIPVPYPRQFKTERLWCLYLESLYGIQSAVTTHGYEFPIDNGLTSTQVRQLKTTKARKLGETCQSFIYDWCVHKQDWRYPDWWNKLSPTTFRECMNFTIVRRHCSHLLVFCVGMREDLPDSWLARRLNEKKWRVHLAAYDQSLLASGHFIELPHEIEWTYITSLNKTVDKIYTRL